MKKLKSFNFAFFISLYAAVNGWAYLKAPNLLLISIVLTLPLLFLAIAGLREGSTGRESGAKNSANKSENLAILYETIAPAMSALVVTTVFTIYIYELSNKYMFFFLPRLQGWNYLDGIQLIVFCVGMGACGVGIWSAAPACRVKASTPQPDSNFNKIFLLRKSPGYRLVVYYIVILIAWCAGMGAAMAVNNGLPWHDALIVGGRCAVPLSLLLVASFLKVPLPAGGFLAAAGSWGLFFFNSGKILDSAAFIIGQLAVFFCYSIIAKKFFGAKAARSSEDVFPDSTATLASDAGADNSNRDGSQ